MTSYMDYKSPNTQFTADMNCNLLFKKDDCNYINVLGIKQLNTLDNISLLDIFLSKSNVVEPHYHQNAAELVYCISGAAVVSLLNPFTNELLHFPVTPGQVANVPQGWWHYEIATTDCTHLLAIFNAPTPEVILGSDILSKTPANVLAHTYCLNEAMVKETLAPVKPMTFIGPPADCCEPQKAAAENVQAAANMAPNIAPNMAPNMAPVMATANMPYYMPQPSSVQGFGFQPMNTQAYYQPYVQQPYRQLPYTQGTPAYANAGTDNE
ncbi:cupin domain-containing protein [Paenibacillus camerounensis]|uniref:cupin domain-containing protein n=1 Tax=Paenibacillus camerounensis TaxID=1243663 RepID=UPI000A329253|nr:cupin domain-containing protein [Paenibacillus camerounensis]